jgi:hypothetical protein
MGAFEAEGIHSPRTIIVEKAVVIIITLKRPILSATIPGRMRPKILGKVSGLEVVLGVGSSYDAAFRIGITYIDKLADMPWLWALVAVNQSRYEGRS